ncbi:MAG: hypothetical protein EAZ55_14200 [Cytophagales bacterium]|nr:MAG: hypothetical protein EAZ55_14200 [Cytophagales bacterium]
MKNFKNLFFFVVLAAIAVSCGGDAKSTIAKKWKISDFEAPQMKEQMEKASAEEKKMMEEMLKEIKDKSSFEFTKDGKFTISMSVMGAENKTAGTWELKDKKLVTKDDKGKESEIEVVEVSGSKLVLKDKDGIKMTLVPAE